MVSAGCAAMPDFNRIQSSMDQMAYYTGIMAQNMPCLTWSTTRMADSVERMERRTQAIVADLQGRGKTVESAVASYGQAFLDNDRAVIKNLNGIQQELGQLRQTLRSVPPSGLESPQDQSRLNATIQSKLADLETKLNTIASQLSKTNTAPANR